MVVGSERGSAHARREEREEHILMQRCCSGFGRTQPRSGRQHRALPRSTGSGGSGAPLCPGSCTTGGAARGKSVSILSSSRPRRKEAADFGAPFSSPANSPPAPAVGRSGRILLGPTRGRGRRERGVGSGVSRHAMVPQERRRLCLSWRGAGGGVGRKRGGYGGVTCGRG